MKRSDIARCGCFSVSSLVTRVYSKTFRLGRSQWTGDGDHLVVWTNDWVSATAVYRLNLFAVLFVRLMNASSFSSAMFIPGDGLVINDNPMFMARPSMMMRGNAFQGGMVGGSWGFNNGGGGGAYFSKGGAKSGTIKGGAKGYYQVVVNSGFQTSNRSKGYKTKGSKARAAYNAGSKGKGGSKTNASKGVHKVGGIFNHGGGTTTGGAVTGGGTVVANQAGEIGMRMRMRPMNMGMRPTTATARVSPEGTSTDGRDDSGELKTKFTGTLIGYRPFT